jgi:hypothetical protein
MRRLVPLAAATVLIGVAVQPTPASAFLEFLFGRPQAPVYAPAYPQSAPLGVTVNPRRGGHASGPSHRHKKQLGKGGETRSASTKEGKISRQVSIDPVAHPDWYLKDPTLRYGDILILRSGPVVFQGSRQARASEDFVSLGQSRVVSRTNLREVRMMVSGVWTPPAEGSADTAGTRTSRRR